MIERAVILSDGPVLDIQALPNAPTSAAATTPAVDELDAVSRAHILSVLEATSWLIAGPNGAAARLGMKRSTLNFRMRKLGIVRQRQAAG